MPEPKGSNRRKFERLPRQDAIQVKEFTFPERGSYGQARIQDISGGGLLIETDRRFDQQMVLKIEMNFTGWQRYTRGFLKHFGDASSRPLVVLAEVVRCKVVVPGRRYQVAVIFTGIDESQREALIRFIRQEIISRE